MLERMNFEAAVSCTVTRRRGKALEVTLGKIGSVSQPGHWRSTSLFTARDAQSDSRIFQLFISVANRLYFFFLCESVLEIFFFLSQDGFIQSPSEKQAALQTRYRGRVVFFFSCVLRPLFVCVGPAPVRPVCALSAVLSACLSVCLVGCLAVCLPVSYN